MTAPKPTKRSMYSNERAIKLPTEKYKAIIAINHKKKSFGVAFDFSDIDNYYQVIP